MTSESDANSHSHLARKKKLLKLNQLKTKTAGTLRQVQTAKVASLYAMVLQTLYKLVACYLWWQCYLTGL